MRTFVSLLWCLLSLGASAAPVTASWDHDGLNVDGFRLRYECPSRVGTVPAAASVRALTFDAPAGEPCTASMVAYNAVGDSAPSNKVSFTLPALLVPGAVQNVRISWRASEANSVGSLVLNGTDAYAELGSAPATAAPLTLVTWFKQSSDNDVERAMIVLSPSGSTTQEFRIQLFSDDAVSAVTRSTSSVLATTSTNIAGDTSNWHHAAAVFASSTSRSAYLDGGGKVTETTSRTPTGINRMRIGMRQGGGLPFTGRVAHLALYSIALSDAEIAGLAAGDDPSAVQPGNLLGHYPGTVIDISGTDYLEDVSGNGNHLELFGGWSYDAGDSPPVGGGTDISGALEGISLSTFPSAIASDRAIGAGTESISISTSGAAIALDRDIDIGLESMLLDAFPASVSADRSISGVQESIQLSTFAAGLSLGLNVSAEQITLGTFLSVISSDRAIVGSLESLLLQANPASISTGANVAAQTEQITIQALPAAISLDVELSAQLQQIVLSGLSAQIGLAKNTEVGLESLTITPFGATVRLDTGISARLEALTLATFAAVIESAIPSIQVPGLEYTIAGDRAHYTLPVDRLHFTFRS